MQNKKGRILAIGMFLIAMTIVFTIWLFTFSFFFAVGDENVITPLVNITLAATNTGGINISDEMRTHIGTLDEGYRETDLVPDFFFLVFMGSVYLTAIGIAIKSQKETTMGLFGTLTIGLMLYFLALSYFETARVWLFDNLVVGVAEVDITDTILMAAYIDNIVLVNFTFVLVLIILNQFDFFGARKRSSGGRVEA